MNDNASVDLVVCLGCGGVVPDGGASAPEGERPCECPPTPSEELEVASVACPSCGGPLKVGARACPYCRCTVATQRCGGCFSWNLANARHCQRCGDTLDADQGARERVAGGACPRCSANLSPRVYAELDVDECDSCGGLFIETVVLDRLVDMRDGKRSALHIALPKRPRSAETEVRYVKCPACQKLMNRTIFGKVSGIIIDVCKTHGVWFDSGELADVIEFVEKGGMARARERELEELRDAAKSLRSASLAPTPMVMDSNPTDSVRQFADFIAALWKAL